MKHPNDKDLDFLHDCSNKELEFLVRLIIDVGGKTSKLAGKANFKLYHPDHKKYVDEIIEEIQLYAGNTIMNRIRGCGVAYIEALKDTLRNLKVGFDEKLELPELEKLLLRFGQDLNKSKTDKVRDKVKEFFRRELDDIRSMPSETVGSLVKKFMVESNLVLWLPTPASRVVTPAVIYIAKLRQCMIEQGRA